MTIPQKWRFFRETLKTGIKEIEVGYPSASETDFDFIRGLIESGEVPDDVALQVGRFKVFDLTWHPYCQYRL